MPFVITAERGEVFRLMDVRERRSQERIREAAKLGFKRMILLAANQPKEKDAEIALVPVRWLDDALEELFGR